MSAAMTELPPRYLRTPEAARFLGLSGRTLEKHRTYGTGPRYSKLGGRVVYRLEDLQAWAARGAESLDLRSWGWNRVAGETPNADWRRPHASRSLNGHRSCPQNASRPAKSSS